MVINLNIRVIYQYIKKLSIDDIRKLALNQDIKLSDEEAIDVYNYIKNNYDKFFKGNINIDDIINDAKLILSRDNYDKVYLIYLRYRDKI